MQGNECAHKEGTGFAIVLVLFILLAIMIGAACC